MAGAADFPGADLAAVGAERFKRIAKIAEIAKDCQNWEIRNEDPSETSVSCLAKWTPPGFPPVFYKASL